MSTTPRTTPDDFLDDPWLTADTNLDTSGLTPEQRAAYSARFGRKDPYADSFDGLSPQVVTNAIDYEAMLNDPTVRAELAERDPQFAARYEQEQIEVVVAEFRRQNPGYLKTEQNARTVIQGLAQQYLGKDWLDNEEAIQELHRMGRWTVAELTAQFESCLKAGRLDVPKGQAKELTREQKLEVVAAIRESHPEVAIIRYLQFALGGKLPYKFHEPGKFMATYPKLCNQASLFVWQNMRADVDPEEFAQFYKDRLAGAALLSVEFIDQAWEAWQKTRRKSALFGAVDNLRQQPEDLDSLSDAELNRRLEQARREALRSRRN
jgi:hypothetical protein